MAGKFYRYLKNVLAVAGLFSILAVGAYFASDSFFSGWGEKTFLKTATSPDSSAKATLYQVDFGAAADGSKKGNVVLTLVNLQKDANQISLVWEANRLPVITYPAGGQVEYAVSKIQGITIEVAAD
jgi:hypothetical protein